MPIPPRSFGHLFVRWLSRLLCIPAFGMATAGESLPFDVPAGDAVRTLQVFSRQSGEQIVYPVDQVRGARTQRVQGRYSPREALDSMLAGSGLLAVQDELSGAFTVKRASAAPGDPNGDEIAAPRRLDLARVAKAASPPAKRPDAYTLSPFEVVDSPVTGYAATGSISATRMAVPIGQLPMAVNAFTADFIADQKPYDLYDIVKWAPGVHQDNVSPQGWARYNIRGFTAAAVRRNGFGAFRFVDTANIAQVEVVKGPVSLLYGQINPGGVINYITKRPQTQAVVSLTGSVGSHGYHRAVVDATGPLPAAGGKLLYRVIAVNEDVPEFQERASARKEMLAASFTWALSDRATLLLDYEHFGRFDDMPTSGVPLIFVNGVATVPYPGLPWDFSYAGAGDYQDFVSDAFTAEFVTQLGEHIDLRASYLESWWDMEWRATGQGGTGLIAQSFIDFYYPADAGLTPAHAMFRRNRWEHQWGNERTAQLDVVAHVDVGTWELRALLGAKRNFGSAFGNSQRNNPNLAGHPAYIRPWDLRNPATWDRGVPFGVDALLTTANSRGSSRGSSAYSVLLLSSPAARLRLLGGYAWHELSNDPTENFVSGTATPASRRSAEVPQVGALFQLTPAVAGFLSYSKSFLANASQLRVNNVFSLPAGPTIGTGWEGGFKLDLRGGRVSGTASAYRVEARPTGIISVTTGTDVTGTTLFTDIQGGSQVSTGMELDLLLAPVDGLQVMGSFSRCNAVYERHPVNPAFDGTRLVATPDWTLNLWAKYAIPDGALAGTMFGGGINYVGSMTYVGNNPFVLISAYTTFDLTVAREFAAFGCKWTAGVTMKNVTNRQYYPSGSSWGFPRHAIFSLDARF